MPEAVYSKKKDNIKEKLYSELFKYISPGIAAILERIDAVVFEHLEEIRLRVNKPLMLHYDGAFGFVQKDGEIRSSPGSAYCVSRQEIEKTIELVSQNSVYAYQEDIKNGFITLTGGHRVGICGRAVTAGSEIKNFKDFSALTIRISREVKGCAVSAIKHIAIGGRIMNTLVISPPGCGKTTLLRDIARILGSGEHSRRYLTVGIVDERSEIASCYKGVAQNDVGISTDVLDACPKVVGMDIMIRAMAPNVLITDEIGTAGDCSAIRRVINAGVKIITSAHGYSVSDLQCRKEVLDLIKEGVFERYIVLSRLMGPGTIEEVADSNLQTLYRRKANAS